jgi:hypothetical protein
VAIVPADLSNVISGILTLGANGGEELFLPKIHSVLCQMKPHNRMLAGIWFSITGSVCYSRDIENVIRDLASQGVLKIESGSVAVVKNAAFLRNRLRGILPTRQYKKLMATSRRFYARLGRLSGN